MTKKGYLHGERDKKDRRVIHLKITDDASDAVDSIREEYQKFLDLLFSGFTETEKETWRILEKKLSVNKEILCGCCITVAVIMTVIAIITTKPILQLLNTSASIMGDAQAYLYMGVAGAAFATVLAEAIAAVLCIINFMQLSAQLS